MKKFCTLCAIVALAGFVSCQKQQTEEERKAEIDQQVEQRLAAERQAQEKEVADQQGAAATATPDTETDTQTSRARSTSTTRTAREGSDEGGDYNIFYTRLDRYGEWRETSDYGYVWQPREAERSRDWHPYTEGRWVYTDAGWTWVSEEPFGWATYHYGRWTRLHGVGWVWVPGNEWAPAWVSWRKSDEYVGWAPLPPEARFDRRQGIHNWADNYYDIGPDQYRFVATREFGNREMQRTVVPRERNVTIINQTTNVTNITYSNTTVINQGPSYDEIRTRSQQPIERLRLERDVNINLNVEVGRPVVRGEVIAIPAPVIAIGRPAAERPRTVKAAIAQTVVEHGWDDIGDKQAAEQARTKMKSESTPPPDAPSKTFVKPEIAAAQPAAAASAAPAQSASPAATATATPTSSVTPSPTPARARPSQKPLASATPSASQAPSAIPSATPAPSASAKLTETPPPSASPTATAKVKLLGTPATRQLPSPPASTASPTTPATASETTPPSAKANATASVGPPRIYKKPEPAVTLTPSPRSASPASAPTASPSVSPNESAENSGKPKTFGAKKSFSHEPRQIQPMSPSATPNATPAASAISAAAVSTTPASTAGSTTTPSSTGTPEEKGKQKRGGRPAKPGESVSPTPTPTP